MRIDPMAARRGAARLLLAAALTLGACGGDSAGPPVAVERAIESLEPGAGSTSAGAAAPIVVRYRTDVRLPATAALVLLHGADTVPGVVTLRQGRILEFAPGDILDLGETYTVHLRGVRDSRGEPLPDTTWSFSSAGRSLGSVDGMRMFADLEALAHDSMRGRLSGTIDELRAAQFIQRRLQAAGLTPLAPNAWLQAFTTGGIQSQNVVASLAGNGALANQWVVIGGHYDHLGQTAAGIFNGADDNASGTAGVLELARVLSAHASSGGFGTQPRRSVMFVAFGAEERGLYGSNYFCANPPVALTNIAGMLNLDMIGRPRAESLGAYGSSSIPQWPELLRRYGGTLAVTLRFELVGTDYRCFMAAGRPALALFTGIHEDYHKPTDDAHLIDLDGMRRVTNVALGLATNLMLRARAPGAP